MNRLRPKWAVTLYHREALTVQFYPLGWHKFLMAIFGWLFLSWPGLVIGFLVGCLLDTVFDYSPKPPRPADIGMTFMMLAMAVMKTNGQIRYSTMRYAYKYVAEKFGADYLQQRKHVFNVLAQQQIPIEGLCEQVDYHLNYPAKMQLIYFLLGIGYADGLLTKQELSLIATIADHIHVSAKEFKSLLAMHQKVTENAYDILEIGADATDQEIRKAYYRLAKLHHPDRVAHLGEAYQQQAKEKFQRIQKAYETIKRKRKL